MPKVTVSSDESVVVMPLSEYETLMERLEILSDTKLMQEIRDALKEFEEGKTTELEEFWQREMDAS
jgi:PHD/YefM family antitoxin component YafN of YafNO toxin-antitoxin module